MAKTNFQGVKIAIGTDEVDNLSKITLRVPHLNKSYSNPDAKIRHGRMIFSR
jgi:hypothetical protein